MAEFDGIPRIKAELTDGNLRAVPAPLLPKVTLIGVTSSTAVTVNEPTLVRPDTDLSDFDNVDGSASELSKAIIEARDAGADNIEVVVTLNQTTAATTNLARFNALTDTYDLLVNHPLNIVVPVNAFIDIEPSGNSFGYQLAGFCYKASKEFSSVIGVIPVTPPVPLSQATVSLAELEAYVAAVEDFDTTGIDPSGGSFTSFDGVTDLAGVTGVPDNYAYWATTNETLPSGSPPAIDGDIITDKNGNPVDIGKYVSVVAGSYRFANDLVKKVAPSVGFYDNDGAASYAGFISTLAPHRSPTNKVIPSVGIIRNLSISQADRLAQKRFVIFQKRAKGTTVVNAMTGAYNISPVYRSDYVRLTTIRIANEAVERIRAVADPFLGEPYNGVSENALRQEIDQALSVLQTLGALRRYDFQLISTPAMQVLGELVVDLQLVPAFEITQIRIDVALRSE